MLVESIAVSYSHTAACFEIYDNFSRWSLQSKIISQVNIPIHYQQSNASIVTQHLDVSAQLSSRWFPATATEDTTAGAEAAAATRVIRTRTTPTCPFSESRRGIKGNKDQLESKGLLQIEWWTSSDIDPIINKQRHTRWVLRLVINYFRCSYLV